MNKITTEEPDLMTLCSCCASQFFHSGSCRIRRADPFQTEKESCTYCGYRSGYDYLIYPANHHTCGHNADRIEKGGMSICTVRTAC